MFYPTRRHEWSKRRSQRQCRVPGNRALRCDGHSCRQIGSLMGRMKSAATGAYATSGTGDKVGVRGTGAVLYVPQGYISGSLSATNTWSGQTIASLGATPGTYVWSWGSGCDPTRVNSEDPSTVTVAEVPAAAVVATLRFPVVTTAKSSIDKAAVLDDALSFPRDTSPKLAVEPVFLTVSVPSVVLPMSKVVAIRSAPDLISNAVLSSIA